MFLRFPEQATVLVTGAASGIGRATAEMAASIGLRVGLWDLRGDEVKTLGEELGTRYGVDVQHAEADVTSRPRVADAMAEMTERFGHVDYLVNNAGPTSFVSRSFEDGLVTAAGSMVLVTDAWLDHQRNEGDAVVCLSSVAGTSTGVGEEAWYPAAKAAIAGYVKYLGLNRPGGIRANAVAPGAIRTPRLAAFLDGAGAEIIARNPMRRAGRPEDVAAAILFLLSPAASYVNGVVLPVDGGSLLTL
jgi:3-oxoacyl-[acyl-carrier protein] reductase